MASLVIKSYETFSMTILLSIVGILSCSVSYHQNILRT